MANLDEAIFLRINGWVGTVPALDHVAGWLVSDYVASTVLGFSLVVLWLTGGDDEARMRRQVGVLVALTGMALASWLVFVSNGVFFRDRPFVDLDVNLLFYEPSDSSMPSNSAAAFFGLASAVWWFNKRAGMALLAVAGLHAFLRVYSGVHFPSDVVVGALIGVVGATAAYRLKGLVEPLPAMAVKAARILCLA
jgi:undecaprenyl-diphosphatase